MNMPSVVDLKYFFYTEGICYRFSERLMPQVMALWVGTLVQIK